jgi:peptidoglycan-associated lipoprotein
MTLTLKMARVFASAIPGWRKQSANPPPCDAPSRWSNTAAKFGPIAAQSRSFPEALLGRFWRNMSFWSLSRGWCDRLPAAAMVALLLALQPVSAGQATPTSSQDAAEILQDGLDALSDKQTELARQLFEQLVSTFPGTAEAARAERELSALKGTAWPSARPSVEGQNSQNTVALRRMFATAVGDRVFFAESSATIGGRARSILESQARWLKSRPELLITIIGRSDDGGTPEEARLLSLKRAEAVRDRLVEAGLPVSRLIVDARGNSDPLATCQSFMCQAQNRHVETALSEQPRAEAVRTGDKSTSGDASRDASKDDRDGGDNDAAYTPGPATETVSR